MVAITRFEDIIAWQKARLLTAAIYSASDSGRFGADTGLARQVQRASVSIMANIAEGFERKRDKEFLRFLEIAKGSCAEVMSHLYVAMDVGYLDREKAESLLNQAREVGRIIAGLVTTVRRRELSTRRRPSAALGTRSSVLGTSRS